MLLFNVRHGKSRLDIVPVASLIHHEINLVLLADAFPINFSLNIYHADIYIITSRSQLIIENILHNMIFFLLTEIQNGISYS